jgi:hypothetical protein
MSDNIAMEIGCQTAKTEGDSMTKRAKRLGVAILVALVTVLALVSASAASAVWGG